MIKYTGRIQMKADYLEFKDKCIQMLTEIDFLNQVHAVLYTDSCMSP